VRGVVQGVGFRISLARVARTRGAAGWVKNRMDGAVEAVLEGEPDVVAGVVDWCREGPRGALVDGVEVDDEVPEGLTSFEIR
jgi:acylphosphatase